MAVTKHGANFNGELFTAVTTFEELAVSEFIRFKAAAVRAVAVFIIFAPALDFQESQARGFIWELLLKGE